MNESSTPKPSAGSYLEELSDHLNPQDSATLPLLSCCIESLSDEATQRCRTAAETLKIVQALKHLAVLGLFSKDAEEIADTLVVVFLMHNKMQIMDMLDDALYAFINE